MLYRSLDRIAAEADVLAAPDLPASPGLSRRERLERRAELLEREPERRLRALHGIEYGMPEEERLAYRADGSPLPVAYADPVLRAAGLEGDTVGDAAAFFGLSHEQLHDLLCFCHPGGTVSASTAAAQVRAFARQGDVSACWAVGVGFGAAAVAVLALVGTLF
jgi:hypothetical protein